MHPLGNPTWTNTIYSTITISPKCKPMLLLYALSSAGSIFATWVSWRTCNFACDMISKVRGQAKRKRQQRSWGYGAWKNAYFLWGKIFSSPALINLRDVSCTIGAWKGPLQTPLTPFPVQFLFKQFVSCMVGDALIYRSENHVLKSPAMTAAWRNPSAVYLERATAPTMSIDWLILFTSCFWVHRYCICRTNFTVVSFGDLVRNYSTMNGRPCTSILLLSR